MNQEAVDLWVGQNSDRSKPINCGGTMAGLPLPPIYRERPRRLQLPLTGQGGSVIAATSSVAQPGAGSYGGNGLHSDEGGVQFQRGAVWVSAPVVHLSK